MSEELNARNITALSNAIRDLRVDKDNILNTIKSLQAAIATMQAENTGLRQQIGMLLASRGGGATHNGR